MKWMLWLVLFVASQADARQLAGVEFPEQMTVEGVAQPVQLNGLAIRSKFFFKVYVAALYVIEPSQDAEKLLAHAGAKRMMMHMLYDEVAREKLVQAWQEGLEKNLAASELQVLQPRLQRFYALFDTVRKNDVVLIDYVPGTGTRVTIRNQLRGVVEGEDIYRAILSVWIGKEPATDELKAGLLGKPH
jgi:hypothetical protein